MVYSSAVVAVVPLDVVKLVVKISRAVLVEVSAVALVLLAAAKWMANSRQSVVEKSSASAVKILAVVR